MRSSHLLAAAATALALTACTNPDGTANQPGTGALVGGLAGGALGNAIGGTTTSTAIGAVVGAAIGTSIGVNLASQQAELERSLAGSGAQVINTGSQLNVILPENVTFATGSAVVNAGFYASLRAISQNLRVHPDSRVMVVGHTDTVGTAAYNDDLSIRRALAVATILIDGGVSGRRFSYSGQGFRQPVASNFTAAGRALNRRVEIIITPTG